MYSSCPSCRLSVPLSVPCQHRLARSHDGRRPARCLCGRVHSGANINSPAGKSIIHAAAGAQNDSGWSSAVWYYTEAQLLQSNGECHTANGNTGVRIKIAENHGVQQ